MRPAPELARNFVFCWFAAVVLCSAAPNTAVQAHAVGSRVCAGCHMSIYAQFRQTPMGRSMELAGETGMQATARNPVTVHSDELGRYFEVFTEGSKLYQKEFAVENGQRVFENTYPLAYMIGSGENGRTPIVRRGDFLVEAPLTYYSKPGKWDLSPGFESADLGFNRPILEPCIRCHSGSPNPVASGNGRYQEQPFAELAIGCENCHGPGSAHAELRGRGMNTVSLDSSIVNPRKLPSRLADEICMTCHQGGGTRVLRPGKTYSDLRPGTPLHQTLAIFKVSPQAAAPDDGDLLEHNSAMSLSKCFRASGGKLSCLTCHDPHRNPQGLEAEVFYRSRCLKCHTQTSCTIPLRTRETPAASVSDHSSVVGQSSSGDNCIGCHMPKRAVAEISHSALTNHRIVARSGEPLPAEYYAQSTPGLPGLIYLNGPANTDSLPLLTKLTAYGELQAGAPELAAEYVKVFQAAIKSIPGDPLVLAASGRKALIEKRYEEAAHFLEKATAGEAPPSPWLLDRAQALNQLGRGTDAVQVLAKAAHADPFNPAIQKTRILTLINLHDYPEALIAMRHYISTFPEDSLMRSLLLKVEPSSDRPR